MVQEIYHRKQITRDDQTNLIFFFWLLLFDKKVELQRCKTAYRIRGPRWTEGSYKRLMAKSGPHRAPHHGGENVD